MSLDIDSPAWGLDLVWELVPVERFDKVWMIMHVEEAHCRKCATASFDYAGSPCPPPCNHRVDVSFIVTADETMRIETPKWREYMVKILVRLGKEMPMTNAVWRCRRFIATEFEKTRRERKWWTFSCGIDPWSDFRDKYEEKRN